MRYLMQCYYLDKINVETVLIYLRLSFVEPDATFFCKMETTSMFISLSEAFFRFAHFTVFFLFIYFVYFCSYDNQQTRIF